MGWYPEPMSPEVFVLWDKAVVVLACGGVIALGWVGTRLAVGRLLGGGIAVAVAAISLIHDAYRGILSVEYLVLVYLLAVAVIPYRPWHTLVLGGVLTTVFYGIGQYGLPGTAAAHPELVRPVHLVRMGFGTLVLTGVSALLLSTRYQQHRARREAEELHDQVAELERAKSRFFADVSHEFRTPLTLLLGSVREALDERLGTVPPDLRDRLELMDGQTRRMKRLVNQLFELSQIDEGRLQLAMQEHDLVGLARRLVPPFRQWAKEEGITFQTEMEGEPLVAWVDAGRIGDILTTLLSNVVAYTPEGGTIRLRLRRRNGVAELSVRDTGPGLPEALRARVFGREESAIPVGEAGERDSGATDRWIGIGISLAHARALVRRHQGEFEIESEPGFGTEFTVRLPLGREHVSAEDVADTDEPTTRELSDDLDRWREGASPAPDTAETEAADDAPRVLIVDDEAEMRDYLHSLLHPSYRVVMARDGDEALERLREASLDLVISDVAMPGRDGVSLCRAIRDDEQLQHLPVLLLTVRPRDDTRLDEVQAGADASLSKPFDPVELEARAENLIEIRRIVQDRVRVPGWMEPKDTAVSSEEADFLKRLNETVDEHIDNSNFGVDWLADEMDLSTRHLRRRLKEVTRLSPAGFIRTRRLQRAAALLEEGADTVSDVASAVGYRDAYYFSQLFQETYGCSPTEYAEEGSETSDKPDGVP
jgi:signal transduction histidine kinase/DNA-binding response OmpR family regulator